MSTGTGWGLITTLRTRKRLLVALTFAVVAGLVLGGAERGFASTARLGRDKTGYLAGQAVTAEGTGFAASDTVTPGQATSPATSRRATRRSTAGLWSSAVTVTLVVSGSGA
jgi:hypothetical protein